MPDLPGRSNYEAKAARSIYNLQATQQSRLVRLLGQGKQPTKEFWESSERELAVLLYMLMQPVYETSSNRQYSGNPGEVRQTATAWAKAKADKLAASITVTSQERFGNLVERKKLDTFSGAYILWLMIHEDGEDSLRNGLRSIFGLERAASIGIDATTASHNAGEINGFDREEASIRAERARREALGETLERLEEREPVWEIEDESACLICKSFNGKTRHEWGAEFPEGPPAHPHCRCRLVFSYIASIGIGLSHTAAGQPFGGFKK